ncbi:MAG: hypothetical protein RDV48_15960 [Candidatus Eremiobacteraeota bacterium]|nr:hypothetical protein [Candidatus Eremiobacteraeota bacterium]
MAKHEPVILGGEGYIPKELLEEVQTHRIPITISFPLNTRSEVMAKDFALSFYRELRRFGFSEAQIADFSTELLKCLTEKLEAYVEKITRKTELR